MGYPQVRSATVTATGTLISGPARIISISMHVTAAVDGLFTFRDGGATGTTMNIESVQADSNHQVECGGLRFETDVHATLSQAGRVTVYYI